MNALVPEIALILDLVGMGLTLWLGLHLMTHAWGWHPSRSRPAALALCGMSIVFALSAYDRLYPLAGPGVTAGFVRLLLLPLPLGWLLLARRLSLGVLRVSYRRFKWLVLLLALATLAVPIVTGLVRPAYLPRSWIALPAYGLTLLAAMLMSILLARRSRSIVGTRYERRAMGWLEVGSLLALVGGLILATDLVFGLSLPLFRVITSWLFPQELRLLGTVSLLLAALALSQVILSQARAEGAPHVHSYRHSLLVTLVMTALYMTAGGLAVWRWQLPLLLLGLFLLLALLTDLLDNATRAQLERWLYRGESGAIRQRLRHVADRVEATTPVPPAVYPLLSRLARQLNTQQLGLALAQSKDNKTEYRIVAALRPSWEGETIDVKDPTLWEERSMGGWNMPLRKGEKTVGMIVSDRSGMLNAVQQQLLKETADKIVQLLDDYAALKTKLESLQKALDEYHQHVNALDTEIAQLGAPLLAQNDLMRAAEQALSHYNDAAALENSALAKLKVVEQLPGAGSGRAAVLRELLFHLVEQLRPFEGEVVSALPSAEWHPYLILKHVFLEGEKEHEWMIRLQLNERAFRRAQRAAISQIARVLADLEAGVMRLPSGQKPPPAPSGAPATGGSRYSPQPPTLTTSNVSRGAPAPPPSAPPSATSQPAPKPEPQNPAAPQRSLSSLTKRFLPDALSRSDKSGDQKQAAPKPEPSKAPPPASEQRTTQQPAQPRSEPDESPRRSFGSRFTLPGGRKESENPAPRGGSKQPGSAPSPDEGAGKKVMNRVTGVIGRSQLRAVPKPEANPSEPEQPNQEEVGDLFDD